MAESVRAENVCNACSVRKKACDRTLPACGFCIKRHLVCRYDITPRSKRAYRTYNPGRNFVAVDTLWPSSAPAHEIITINQSGLPPGLSVDHPPLRFTISPNFQSVDDILSRQVRDILGLLGLTTDKVSNCYFRTSHQWHPIITRRIFEEMASSTPPGGIPTPDFSVLILAMCLITPPPRLGDTPQALPLSRQGLYIITKSLFAQAQAALCSSIPLVQAIFLIASCEYVCGRPEAAYISMCTCSGLVRALGIRDGSGDVAEDRTRNASIELGRPEVERANITSAIAMLETIIVAELDQRNLAHLQVRPDLQTKIPNTSSLSAADTRWSGGQREAVLLLDRISLVCRCGSETMRSTRSLSELMELDIMVRGVLKRVMDGESKGEMSMRNAVALAIRSLFLLHRAVLNALQTPQSEDEYQVVQRSRAALGTFCEMVIDSARCFGEELGPSPICCYYNIQAAVDYLQEQLRDEDGEALRSDIDYLLRTKRNYCDKWGF